MNLRLKKSYKAFVRCTNCYYPNDVDIPMGKPILDFLKGGKFLCDNCGMEFTPKEYTTEWEKKDDDEGET